MSWCWDSVHRDAAKFSPIWDKKGSIGWATRIQLGASTDGFSHDSSLKKAENLAKVLERVEPESRDAIDQAVSLNKISFYNKLKAGIEEEQSHFQKEAFDDYMEDAAPTVKQEPVEDVMDYDLTPKHASVPQTVEKTLNFLDGLLDSISGH